VDCKAKCQASCQGSCKAEANASCQVDCQASGYAECEGRLEGGCTAQCERTGDGALYCDNQYIDHGGNLQSCLDAIETYYPTVTVTGTASGSCSNGKCVGEAEGSASCAMTPASHGNGALGALGLGFLALVGLARRRR
jgi:MYXO-CTERM domain-containing protein